MLNNDYILRSDALEIAMEWCPDDDGSVGKVGDLRKMLDELESIPAADVEPKRYAEWVSPDGISVCSKCGKAAPYDVEGDMIMYWPNLNFCPNCGCRMNVEGKDAEVH